MLFLRQANFSNLKNLLSVLELIINGYTPLYIKTMFGATAAGLNTFETITGVNVATLADDEIILFYFNGTLGGLAGYINDGGALNYRPVYFGYPLLIEKTQWANVTFQFNNAAAGTYSCFTFNNSSIAL